MKYARNFLTKVIFQLQFSPMLALLKEAPADFQEAVKEDFPRLKVVKQLEAAAKISKEGFEPLPVKQTARWIFEAEDRSKSVTLAADLFSIEYQQYQSLEVLRQDFERTWGLFQHEHRVEILTRVGLRYINEVAIPGGSPFEWTGYIADTLVHSAVNVPTADFGKLRSMHHLVLGKDADRCVFQYGLFNKDFPNPIAERRFTLDYDCFTTEELSASEATLKLQYYNDVITTLFEASISDELRRLMGEVE